jgi:hypothetical protein
LHDRRSAASSAGTVSCAKSSRRGGELIFLVTRNPPPDSKRSMSFTAARYDAAAAFTHTAPNTATSFEGSDSSSLVTG